MKEKYQNSLLKKTVIAIITLILVVGGVCVVNVTGSHTLAADSVGNVTPEGVDYLVEKHTNISDYRVKGALKAPTLSLENVTGEWLFAGWYTDEGCTTALRSSVVCASGSQMSDGTYYAKYVSADLLTVRCQISSDTTEDSEDTVLRCVSSVDTLKYSKIGFDLTLPGNDEFAKNMESSKVGTRIKAANEVDRYTYSPKVVDTESEYFFSATYTVNKSDAEDFDTEYFVKPYWITKDGTKVYGSGRYLSVNEGLNKNIIHLPVKMEEPAENETFKADSATAVKLLFYDKSEGYAHFELTVPDRTQLTSLTKFEIKNSSDEVAGTGVYRNLLTRFTGGNTYDESWYDSAEDEFVIATSADLYGLMILVNERFEKFSGKEVYVVSDIEVNKGTAKESGWEPATGITTIYSWYPINNFAGTFDGQGHSISGIKCVKTTKWSGFFQSTAGNAVVKDLRLMNSYFESTYGDGQAWLGSIAGHAEGTFESIYSNAIVVSKAPVTGGLLGGDNVSTDVKIIDCWFDGKVKSTGAYATGGIIGLVQNGGKTEMQKCLNTGSVEGQKQEAGICGLVTGDGTQLTIDDSLNYGEVTGANPLAAFVVQDAYNSEVTVRNSYCTSKNSINPVWRMNNDKGTMDNQGKQYEETNFKGVVDQNNITLDFAKDWAMQYDSVPILRSFSDLSKQNDIDISWYDATATTMKIDSLADLNGFNHIVNDKKITFEEKTVQLGADIVVNKGTATVDGWKPEVEGEEPKLWVPINNFAGTFDGQGHSISGICSTKAGKWSGFFQATTKDTVVENLRLIDSYFECTSGGWIGSISGYAAGTFKTVYSNAVVVSNSSVTGGLLGGDGIDADVEIFDCWFDGKVIQKTSNAFGNGGIIGYVEKGNTKIQQCLNTGTIQGGERNGGICGLEAGAGTQLTIDDSINYGEVTGTNPLAAFVVQAKDNSEITIRNSYCTAKNNINSVWDMSNDIGKVDNQGQQYYEQYLKGIVDQNNIKLDFAKTWAMQYNSVPILRSFIDLSKQSDVDISWYDATATTMKIDSLADLKGFNYIANDCNKTFEGKTVKLTTDIVVNEGKAEPTGWTQTSGELYSWTPITSFAGTFDGQGHSISGIYSTKAEKYSGFFQATTKDTVVENLRLLNSYFECTGGGWIGSVAGNAAGTFKTIYSNAVVVSNSSVTGGLLGGEDINDDVEIFDCWFDGKVIQNTNDAFANGGIIGYVQNGKTNVQQCLNTGTIQGGKRNGGICALVAGDGTQLTIDNSINYGQVTGTNPLAAFVVQDGYNSDIIIRNSYCTANINPVWRVDNNKGTLDNQGQQYYEQYLKGIVDQNNIKLDFAKAWVMQYDSVPILRSFSDLSKQGVIDTSWYDAILSISDVQVASPVDESGMGSYYTTVTEIDEQEYDRYLTMVEGEGFVKQSTATTEQDGRHVTVYRKADTILTVTYFPNLTKSIVSFSPNTLYKDWTGAELFREIPTMAGAGDIVDYGAGNYVVTAENTTKTDYETYLNQLGPDGAGFKKYASNDSGINGNVFSATYTKQNLVVTVTHVAKQGKTYISASKNQPLSEHLIYNEKYVEGNGTNAKTTLHFMEQWHAYGNSFVIQLKNGHFIINDGGHHTEVGYLVDYLETLAGRDAEGNQIKPVIEAWFISHAHIDHYGALRMFCEKPEYGDRVYVEGIYFNEPSNSVIALDTTARDHIMYIQRVAECLKTTKDNIPEIYRPQTGQRYYFNDITVDIVLAQEQLPFEQYCGDFNDSSTWCMFTIEGKQCLLGGDGDKGGMRFVMDAYEYSKFDVFATLHHGNATWNDFTSYCDYGIVLHTRRGGWPEDNSGKYLLSLKADEWLTWDDGTQVLTFSREGISAEQIASFEWKYHEGIERPN